jgi:hypothetical protein
LRALLAWAGIVGEEAAEFSCANCAAVFELAPSASLELAPFVDGELDDPELDAAFDFEKTYPLPVLRAGGKSARTVRLAPRTVSETLPLWRNAYVPLRMTPAFVTAMGVVALGRERRGSALADALAEASDEAWGAIVDLYNDAHYTPRLVAVHRCVECGARNDVEAPLERELPREPPRATATARPTAFPDLDAFEAKVRAIAARVYAARRVKNVSLVIDDGVPVCDDGGEPLLGCYTPGGVDPETGISQAPEVKLFYRTFQTEFTEDAAFDIEAEIRETIDHELTHHLHHLSGTDPLDDEERAEIDREHVRRVGQREAIRRASRGFGADIAGFLRATWPIWIVVAVASALAWCADNAP